MTVYTPGICILRVTILCLTVYSRYVGEMITSDEAEERGKKYDAEGRNYLFDRAVTLAMGQAGKEEEVQREEGRNNPRPQPVPRRASTMANPPRPRTEQKERPTDRQRQMEDPGQPGLHLIAASQNEKSQDKSGTNGALYGGLEDGTRLRHQTADRRGPNR